jgi:hypothetical protein
MSSNQHQRRPGSSIGTKGSELKIANHHPHWYRQLQLVAAPGNGLFLRQTSLK